MQWAYLQFAFALVVVIGIISLVIAELHVVERAEEQKLWRQIEDVKKILATHRRVPS